MSGGVQVPVGDFKISNVAVLATLVALVLLLVGGAIFVSSDDIGTTRFGLIVAILGPVIVGLANLLRGDKIAHSTDVARANTDELLNGRMDEKIRAGVAAVLDEQGITSAARTIQKAAEPPAG